MDEAVKNTAEIVNRREKKIILSTTNGRKWTGEFIGKITHKDIHQLQRIMRVEFAKVTRRRTIMKVIKKQKQQRDQALVELVKQQKLKETNNGE